MLAHKITGIGGGGASAAAGGANIVGASNAGNNTGNGVIIDGGSIAAASLVNANLRQFTVFEPFEPTPDLNALTPSAEGGVNTNSQASDTGAGSMTESGSGGKTATTSANNPADQTSELGMKQGYMREFGERKLTLVLL